MKTKYTIIIFLLIALGACNMDELPIDTATKEPIFESEKGMQLYVNSLYTILPYGDDIIQSDNMSDYMARNGVDQYLIPNGYGPRQSSGWTWENLRNINYFIANCSTSTISEKAKNNFLGIARFFRAYFYYEKVKRFGDVPWIDYVLAENDPKLFAGRDSREFVMQKVLEDLDYACNNIAQEVDPTCTYITKSVAYAYKSRICLYEASYRKYHNLNLGTSSDTWYKESYDAAKYLMDKNNYAIFESTDPERSYRDLFISRQAERVKSEMILAYVCNAGLKVTTSANRRFISPTYGVRPSLTRRFVNTYLTKDGTPFTNNPQYMTMNFVDETKNRDSRLLQTVRSHDYIRTTNGVPHVAPPDFMITYTGYQPIKFCFDEELPYDNESRNDNTLPIMRFGEVLLNYAEAAAELNIITSTDWANTIGKLRKRGGITSGLNTLPTTIDPYLQSNFYPTITNPVILEIRRERGVELVFEGSRFNDLMRWNAGNLLELPYNGIYVQSVNTPIDLNNDGTPDVRFYNTNTPPAKISNVIDIDVRDGSQFSLSEKTKGELIWNAGKREWKDYKYLYPIPQSDINLNTNLAQNPGW